MIPQVVIANFQLGCRCLLSIFADHVGRHTHTHTHYLHVTNAGKHIPGYNGIMSTGMEVDLWVPQMNTNDQLGNGPENQLVRSKVAGNGIRGKHLFVCVCGLLLPAERNWSISCQNNVSYTGNQRGCHIQCPVQRRIRMPST